MSTGRNFVRSIYCTTCAHVIGWTYVSAYKLSKQKLSYLPRHVYLHSVSNLFMLFKGGIM